jgi:hypothetical protein
MKWTTKTPTKEGWYWIRSYGCEGEPAQYVFKCHWYLDETGAKRMRLPYLFRKLEYLGPLKPPK